jgi:hypothetical protein
MNPTPIQFELFEGFEPEGTPLPKLELPFQRSQEIDVARARAILGVNDKTMRKLLEKGLIRGYRHPGSRASWHVEYESVVEYCDQLRVLHCISDTRAGISKGSRRRRDRDLLPFPLDETVTIRDVCERLDIAYNSAIHLMQEGAIVGYQVIFEQLGCPWRIHADSLDRYIANLGTMAHRKRSSQVSPSSR